MRPPQLKLDWVVVPVSNPNQYHVRTSAHGRTADVQYGGPRGWTVDIDGVRVPPPEPERGRSFIRLAQLEAERLLLS